MSEIEDFIRRLPKAELHLHLEGTVLPATLVELSTRHDAQPLSLAEAEALYRFTDFSGFMLAFKAVSERLSTPEDYELAAWRMAQHLAAQGVVHAEVYVSVGVIYHWHRPGRDAFAPIFAGIERARERAARELSLSIYWILDAVRHFPVEEAARVFREAAQLRKTHPSVVGIGLGGDERRTGSTPYKDLYAEAAQAGLRLTNHAGETTGPEAIWEALAIGTERIGHGLSVLADESLVQNLKDRQVAIEMNPTSNVRTGLCPSFAAHPLRRAMEAGLLVTLNSDDPAFFGSDLASEYLLAHRELGLGPQALTKLAANSFRASFLPDVEKQGWLAQIAAFE
jgi:adenosine deaminase/aminodeoxyfutalosine deaminase